MWKLNSLVDTTENWAYFENALTKEECESVIKLGESLIPDVASTMGGVDQEIRDSKVSWIQPSAESEWLFRKATDIVNHLNSKFFEFDLEGFVEGFQFTKYEAPSGKYDLHIDKSYGRYIRKLSIVIQLSNPDDYEGGELSLLFSHEPDKLKAKQGFLVAFPSYVVHGVSPVTKGTRYSLVAWITGPKFK